MDRNEAELLLERYVDAIAEIRQNIRYQKEDGVRYPKADQLVLVQAEYLKADIIKAMQGCTHCINCLHCTECHSEDNEEGYIE